MESKTESKLRLDFFLEQGLELVEWDACINVSGASVNLHDHKELSEWNAVEDCNKECFVKSLAQRENKGVQPVG